MCKHLLQLYPATANEVVMGKCVAVPHKNIQLTESLNKRYTKFFVKRRVPSPIGAGAGAELVAAVLDADVGVLAREELRVPQLPAPSNSDFEELPLDRHGAVAQ